MAGKIQKILFSLSTISPVLICFAVVWGLTGNSIAVSIVFGSAGLLLSLYVLLFVSVYKKKYEITPVAIDSVSPDDKLVIGYIVSYIVPFASIVFKDFNPVLSLAIGAIIGIVLSVSNFICPNPLLLAFGYHFYRVSTVDGADDYCLISRRPTIPNKATIRYVRTVFGYFLVEERG